jgi:hypothetical protein
MSDVSIYPELPAGRNEVDVGDAMKGWRRPAAANTFHCYGKERLSLCGRWALAGAPDPGVPNGTAGVVYAVCAVCSEKAPAPCPDARERSADAPPG